MALGGGTFLVQNKRLPGAYINTVSVAAAAATLSDRGYAALPLEMGWGPQGEIFTVEQGDFLIFAQIRLNAVVNIIFDFNLSFFQVFAAVIRCRAVYRQH